MVSTNGMFMICYAVVMCFVVCALLRKQFFMELSMERMACWIERLEHEQLSCHMGNNDKCADLRIEHRKSVSKLQRANNNLRAIVAVVAASNKELAEKVGALAASNKNLVEKAEVF